MELPQFLQEIAGNSLCFKSPRERAIGAKLDWRDLGV